MKKIFALLQICFLLYGPNFISGPAGNAGTTDRAFSGAGGCAVYGMIPGMNIYDCTGKNNRELLRTTDEIIARVSALRSIAEREIRDILDNARVNPDGLPVTLEIVAIEGRTTYIYSFTGGQTPELYITETAIYTEPEEEHAGSFPREYMYENSDIGSGGQRYGSDYLALNAGISALKSSQGRTGSSVITSGHNFTDGLGVRIPIAQSGTVLSFSVTTSGEDTVPPSDRKRQILAGGANFLYGGFTGIIPGIGEITTDMGLIYQTMYGSDTYAWKPIFLVKCGKSGIQGPGSVEGQAFSSNGYIPGGTVDIEIRIDPVPSDPYRNRVLLRTAGYAFHETSSGSGGETYLVQLCYSDFNKIKPPDNWRLLATSVIPNDSGRGIAYALGYGDFQNILIDGTLPAFGRADSFYGYAENSSAGNYYLQVSKGFGEAVKTP